MAPMRKVELDKAAWAWCNEIDPDNVTYENIAAAYRLNVAKCGFSKCRRNCRGNPFCLSGLGESRWMAEPVEELDDEDLLWECREPDSFVGLRNLGATCYINSLLQLWFHNISFRNAILRWNPDEDPTTNSAISHLQFLFTLMQFGKKRSVDPTDFVRSLEIDVSTQQDAREFSQLFISYLEDYLKRQSEPIVRDLVQSNLQGHYNYVTRCSKCQTESIRESTFYELEMNVKGHKTLDASIAEFLKEERLEGADMYYCSVCRSKQEATRHMELTALPPVFTLQLIRFIYDRRQEMKKKLNTQLQFPETLDMAPYLKATADGASPNAIYNLFAVLIHKGPSANSGHYVAHICDQTSGNWYMFNDVVTQKLEGKKLKLNSDQDYEVDNGGKKQKSAKAIKGYLSSSNAYMLVYTASDFGLDRTPLAEESLQEHLKSKLMEYNEAFDSIIAQSREEKRMLLVDKNLMKVEMGMFLGQMPVEDGQDWEAVSIKWLTNWIAANTVSGFYPIDNSHICCPHGNIFPDAIKEFKFISQKVADILFDKFGGGPRLTKENLCGECVRSICRSIRLRSKLTNDKKELNNLIKTKENNEFPAFWVGKESLRTWCNKALKSFDKFPNDSDQSKKGECCQADDVSEKGRWTNDCPVAEIALSDKGNDHSNSTVGSEPPFSDLNGCKTDSCHQTDADSSEERINGDLGGERECSQGGASLSSKHSKLGSDDDKEKESSDDGKLNGHKSDDDEEDAYQFNFNEDIVCFHGNLSVEESSRRLVSEQAWNILKCYFPDCQEFSSETEACIDCQCLVSEGKVAKDLHKQQASKEKELLSNLYNGKNRPKEPYLGLYHVLSVPDFLEPWRKFLREPTKRDPMTSLRNSRLLCTHNRLKYDPAKPDDLKRLSLVLQEEWQKLSANFKVDFEISLDFREDGSFLSSPEVCDECVTARVAEEQLAMLQYSDAKIYIRQMDKAEAQQLCCPPSGSASCTNQDKEKEVTLADAPTRRSSRKRKKKDERVFTVSSDQTLLYLKVQILNWLGVAPFDQHLLLEGGVELTDHQATLASLSVFPDSVIYLKVDEPADVDEACTVQGPASKRRFEPEHGFKGTGLLKR